MGCASPPRASTGRFQAMTTGRQLRTPTAPCGPPRRAARGTRRVIGDLSRAAPHPGYRSLLPHRDSGPPGHRHDGPRPHLAGARPHRLLCRGRPGHRLLRRRRGRGRTPSRPCGRPVRPDPGPSGRRPRTHRRRGLAAAPHHGRRTARPARGGRGAGGRHDPPARRALGRPVVGAAPGRAGGPAHRLRAGVAGQRGVLSGRAPSGRPGRGGHRSGVRPGPGHGPGGRWRAGPRRAAPHGTRTGCRFRTPSRGALVAAGGIRGAVRGEPRPRSVLRCPAGLGDGLRGGARGGGRRRAAVRRVELCRAARGLALRSAQVAWFSRDTTRADHGRTGGRVCTAADRRHPARNGDRARGDRPGSAAGAGPLLGAHHRSGETGRAHPGVHLAELGERRRVGRCGGPGGGVVDAHGARGGFAVAAAATSAMAVLASGRLHGARRRT